MSVVPRACLTRLVIIAVYKDHSWVRPVVTFLLQWDRQYLPALRKLDSMGEDSRSVPASCLCFMIHIYGIFSNRAFQLNTEHVYHTPLLVRLRDKKDCKSQRWWVTVKIVSVHWHAFRHLHIWTHSDWDSIVFIPQQGFQPRAQSSAWRKVSYLMHFLHEVYGCLSELRDTERAWKNTWGPHKQWHHQEADQMEKKPQKGLVLTTERSWTKKVWGIRSPILALKTTLSHGVLQWATPCWQQRQVGEFSVTESTESVWAGHIWEEYIKYMDLGRGGWLIQNSLHTGTPALKKVKSKQKPSTPSCLVPGRSGNKLLFMIRRYSLATQKLVWSNFQRFPHWWIIQKRMCFYFCIFIFIQVVMNKGSVFCSFIPMFRLWSYA